MGARGDARLTRRHSILEAVGETVLASAVEATLEMAVETTLETVFEKRESRQARA